MKILNFQPKRRKKDIIASDTYDDIFLALHVRIYIYINSTNEIELLWCENECVSFLLL